MLKAATIQDVEHGAYVSFYYNDKNRIAIVNYCGPNEEKGKAKNPNREYMNCKMPDDSFKTFKVDKIENLQVYGHIAKNETVKDAIILLPDEWSGFWNAK